MWRRSLFTSRRYYLEGPKKDWSFNSRHPRWFDAGWFYWDMKSCCCYAPVTLYGSNFEAEQCMFCYHPEWKWIISFLWQTKIACSLVCMVSLLAHIAICTQSWKLTARNLCQYLRWSLMTVVMEISAKFLMTFVYGMHLISQILINKLNHVICCREEIPR